MLNKIMNFYYRKKMKFQFKKLSDVHLIKSYIELKQLIQNADYNSIIVGSSHGECGIKAEILTDENYRYLNCCTSSQDLYRSYELIKYIAQIKQLKQVIMTYSLFNNSFALEKTKQEIRIAYINDALFNIPMRKKIDKRDINLISLIKKYEKTYPITKKRRNAFEDMKFEWVGGFIY